MNEHGTPPSPRFTITMTPGVSDTIRDCLHSIETAIRACENARDHPDLAAQRRAVITQMWSLLHAIGYTFLIGNGHDRDPRLFPDADRSLFFRFDSGPRGAMIYHPADRAGGGSWQVHT
jgi:hypothetical protein